MELGIINKFPLGIWAIILIMVLLASLETGYRLGLRKNQLDDDSKPGSKDFVMGSMFAVLGLVMAFTYAYTVNRAGMRQNTLVNEANAIGTAFRRADLTAEPSRSELKQLLLNYAQTRVFTTDMNNNQENFEQAIARTLAAQSKLWPATIRMVQSSTAGPKELSIVYAINEVLDIYVNRFRGTYDRLPGVALLMLIFIAAASLSVAGFNAGLSGNINRWRITTFTIVLVVVLLIIVDFDIPQRGFIGVNQGALEDVIAEMRVSVSRSE
ncbi:MAG: hypothetical protein GQ583_01835 [Methyloprofundus sp.]|nr:hypothetical protein [Methyloprofundus sp.]